MMLGTLPDALSAITAPALEPLFHRPSRAGVASAWHGHVPFGYWLVTQARPSVIVELGTHNGVSYSAFCDAVVDQRLSTRCFAVDTWQGDQHSGLYNEDVFTEFQRFHAARFRDFSTLLRMTFDEALGRMADGSVDLLHIDGEHTYEAVRHDFESWRPKLSNHAIVLFHDTNVRERDFGVWKLWHELRQTYRNFEFLHASGLGMLAIGEPQPPSIAALCAATDDALIATVRERFARLGDWCDFHYLARRFDEDRDRLTGTAVEAEQVWREATKAWNEIAAELEITKQKLHVAQRELDEAQRTQSEMARQLKEKDEELAVARRALDETRGRASLTEAKPAEPAARFAGAEGEPGKPAQPSPYTIMTGPSRGTS